MTSWIASLEIINVVVRKTKSEEREANIGGHDAKSEGWQSNPTIFLWITTLVA